MKKLLLPTLTLALACLPAKAQQPVEPAIASALPAPTPTAETIRSNSAAPVLRDRVQFVTAKLPEIVDFLNTKLKKQGEAPMNLVLGPGLDDEVIPSMTLQNVSAIDVMNVVAKLAGLSMESVPADSGGIAAWILTKRNMGGSEITFFGGLGGEGGGAPVPSLPPQMLVAPGAMPGGTAPAAGGGVPRLLGAPLADAALPVATKIAVTDWIDPAAASRSGSAQISRVLAIGKIHDDFASPEERAKKEAELADTLQVMAKQQEMKCEVRLYEALHVIVVKGTAEAVALIEQTVSAMKENAGIKKTLPTPFQKGF